MSYWSRLIFPPLSRLPPDEDPRDEEPELREAEPESREEPPERVDEGRLLERGGLLGRTDCRDEPPLSAPRVELLRPRSLG